MNPAHVIGTTCDTPDKVATSMRQLLRAVAKMTASRPLHVAGRLYVEHGDRARYVAAETVTDGDTWRSVDAYLGKAGLPAYDQLLP